MKKHVFLFLALALLVAGGVFAQRVGDTVQVAGQTYTILTISGDTIVLQRGGNAPPVQQGGGTVSSTLDGVWNRTSSSIAAGNPLTNNARITISGSVATLTDISSVPSNSLFRDALNKGLVRVGDQVIRNIRFTGGTTYTCEVLYVNGTGNTANTTQWRTATILATNEALTRFSLNVQGDSGNYEYQKR